MANNRLNSLIQRLLWGKNLLYQKDGKDLIIRLREANIDELALGWAEGEDEETGAPVAQLKGITQADRATHLYVVGGSGTGKTKFLTSLIVQDIKNNFGFGVIDPHGDLIEEIKEHLILTTNTDDLQERVVLIDPTVPERITTFNPLELTTGVKPAQQAEELVGVFKKIWFDTWGNRMENILRNTFVALCENNLTLIELPRFLTDDEFRQRTLKQVENITSREYFNQQFNNLRPQVRHEWVEPVLNRTNAFLSDERIRHIFASSKSSFDFRDIMDNKKILLVKLDRGRLKGAGDLLGALLASKIQMSAFTRSDTPESQRVPFYLYIDEFQNFATESFIDTLTQARKYRLSLILAHQNLTQLPRELRASVLANCGLQTYFRISRDDASALAKESMSPIYMSPPGWELYIQELQELPPRMCYVKNRVSGGIVKIQTQDVSPPNEYYRISGGELKEIVAEAAIGVNYLRERDAIEAEYQLRWRELGLDETNQDWESFAEPEK